MSESTSFQTEHQLIERLVLEYRVWSAARDVVSFDDAHKDGMDRAAFYKGEAIDELREAIAAYDNLIEQTAKALGNVKKISETLDN